MYQVTIMMFTVICALVLLGESQAYTKMGLISIMLCTGVMVLGIQVIACKTSSLKDVSETATD